MCVCVENTKWLFSIGKLIKLNDLKDGGRLSSAHHRFNLMTNGSLIIENAQYDDAAHYRFIDR